MTIRSTTRIVNEDGTPTRELVKALSVPLIPSIRIVDEGGFPTRSFSIYANNQGIYLPPHMAVATRDGLPSREFLKSGLLA